MTKNIIYITIAIVVVVATILIVMLIKKIKSKRIKKLIDVLLRPDKGTAGEQEVAKLLEAVKTSNNYHIINNVLLFGGTDKSTQIDHIVIGRSGIYIIETKNYKGEIYVTDEDSWYQKPGIGQDPIRFYSPQKQNLCHMYRLAEAIGLKTNKYCNLITAFPDETRIVNNTEQKVLHFDELTRELFSHTANNFNNETVEKIYNRINRVNTFSEENLNKHVQRLRKSHN